MDQHNVLCLDATNWIRFNIAGDATLIDKLGTSNGSRLMQAYNGRAVIRVRATGNAMLGMHSQGLPTALLSIK